MFIWDGMSSPWSSFVHCFSIYFARLFGHFIHRVILTNTFSVSFSLANLLPTIMPALSAHPWVSSSYIVSRRRRHTHFDKSQYVCCWVPWKSDAPLSDIRVSAGRRLSMADFKAHHLGSTSFGLWWPYTFRLLRGSREMRGYAPVQLLELKGGTPFHSHIATLRSSPQSMLGCKGQWYGLKDLFPMRGCSFCLGSWSWLLLHLLHALSLSALHKSWSLTHLTWTLGFSLLDWILVLFSVQCSS